MSEVPIIDLTAKEVIQLATQDNYFYEKHFFPETVRQPSPAFHRQMDEKLWGGNRQVAFKVFRDGAKTTKLRLFTSKRIAYGISRTILYVSNSQDHSVKSLDWIKRKVEFNRKWSETFGLRPGGKWTAEEIEIVNELAGCSIWIKAVGITGQLRGFNIDDHRPDLIVVDDADNEETAGNDAQRQKTEELFFGALMRSLVPTTENPNAMAVVLQTPINNGDLIDRITQDGQWETLEFSCFDENQNSTWEARYPTAVLRADKAAHIRRGQLHIWMREMEVKLVARGGASFNAENIRFWDVRPDDMVYIIAIDPASSEAKNADDQVIGVVGLWQNRCYLIEYTAEKGEMPEAAAATTIQYIRRYGPLGVWVESISYQRVLAHLIEQEMKRARVFAPVHQVQDKRRKSDRILQAIGVASGEGNLYVRDTHSKFLSQYYGYSPLSTEKDDVLDMVSIAIDAAKGLNILEWDSYTLATVVEQLNGTSYNQKRVNFRSCP